MFSLNWHAMAEEPYVSLNIFVFGQIESRFHFLYFSNGLTQSFSLSVFQFIDMTFFAKYNRYVGNKANESAMFRNFTFYFIKST